MVGSIAPMGASILFCFEKSPSTALRLTKQKRYCGQRENAPKLRGETARTIRSKKHCEGKKITRKSQGNFRVVRLEKWQTNLRYHI